MVNMFTGIVQGMATVRSVNQLQDFIQARIEFPAGLMAGIQIGASVAINGTCLTVTAIDGDTLNFDIIVETLRATSLGSLAPGVAVNFERSARMGDEIGGHNVSGHVHTTASVANIETTPNNVRMSFRLNDLKWRKYILPKGYIAVDGTSLTVGEVWDDGFCVYLIPETLRATILGIKQPGQVVNIEIETQTQAIVDTVERVVAQYMAAMPGSRPAQ